MVGRADVSTLKWSDEGVIKLVPTGTVTLLSADVEGSTWLWETRPEEMSAVVAQLDRTLAGLVCAHRGVRPVEQGEGHSFVVAFTRASDAVACALGLQRAPLAPIRLRIGLHTVEVRLGDEGNYIGPAMNRTARLRELAHGGQTVLSGTTGDLVADQLADGMWLSDLGTHRLRDLPRPERVVQLCHPDICNEFSPLRACDVAGAPHLPVFLTSFVGRVDEMADVRCLLEGHRLVTLTGTGGVGKTRMAVQVTAAIADQYPDGVWYVDLAPITDPALVVVTAARALGLPDQPGRSTVDTIVRFIADRRMLVVLDNCEHLLDACARLMDALLGRCSALSVLATSREPIGLAGEQTWRVPPLALDDEAIELFAERARLAGPDFTLPAGDIAAVSEICDRLDGMPLAIELAAARVRALSLTEILESLHDRFRLLTGGSRTAVRRQQTLRASVDWSHALLSDPERVLLRRLAVFPGGFNLDGAQAVTTGGEVHRYEVIDLLTLLVDKSLLITENTSGRTRYRLLETLRQYALEKLGESGEADSVRGRHRDHYTAIAAALDAPSIAGHERRLNQTDIEIDNLRAAFAWSRENGDTDQALLLASSLQPLWRARGRLQEGRTWFDAALDDYDARCGEVDRGLYARVLADQAFMDGHAGITDRLDQAQKALGIARDIDDPPLLIRALTACGGLAAYNAEVARPLLAEAVDLARSMSDKWMLAETLAWQAYTALMGGGDPVAARAACEEARELAGELGDGFVSRICGWFLGIAHLFQGDLEKAVALSSEAISESDAAHDTLNGCGGALVLAHALARRGDTAAARAAAQASLNVAVEVSPVHAGLAYAALAFANLAAGDVKAAEPASESATRSFGFSKVAVIQDPNLAAQIARARGDLEGALHLADGAVSSTRGMHRAGALTTRARIAIAQGDPEQAERNAHDALSLAASVGAYLEVPDTLECLARVSGDRGSHHEGARLCAAAEAIRGRTGAVRFKIYDAENEATVETLRDALGDSAFAVAWTEGWTMSTAEAVAYAQRGWGERKRPSSGWASLTPTELNVVGLVSEGLSNKDIAARLFVSPRTVQAHLTHVYTKLSLASRVQLAQEAARRTSPMA